MFADCSPPPPSCDPDTGERFQAVFANDENPEKLCDGSDTCEMMLEQRISGYGLSLAGTPSEYSIYQYRNTGMLCEDGVDRVADLNEAAEINQPTAGQHDVNTVPVGSGELNDSRQCGLINSERVCFNRNDPGEGGCITTPSGALVCSASATEVPTTSEGDPLTPDVQVNRETDEPLDPPGTLNYWTSETLSNNEAGGGTNPDAPPGEGNGDGDGDGQGSCDPDAGECGDIPGTGTARSGCGSPPSCSKTSHVQCAILRQVWTSNCDTYAFEGGTSGKDAELLAASGFTGGMAPTAAEAAAVEEITSEVNVESWISQFLPTPIGGTCPPPMTFSALGETIEFKFDVICDFLAIMSFFVIFTSTLGAFRIAFT